MYRSGKEEDHERYKELCALAQTDLLIPGERLELESHLQICETCRAIYEEYSLIGKEGMALLSAAEAPAKEAETWDEREVKRKLFASVHDKRSQRIIALKAEPPIRSRSFFPLFLSGGWTRAAIAACLLAIAVTGSYYWGQHNRTATKTISPRSDVASGSSRQSVATETEASAKLRAAQSARIAALEEQITLKQNELARMHAASSSTEQQASELESAYAQKQLEMRQLVQERNDLAAKLQESQVEYQNLQAQFIKLRSDHDQTLLRTASLESRVEELTSTTHDQERKLKDDAQYLMSDRDIRELMGARKLYIADVFDVDSGSRPRKPFGRVFYTQNKSLLFYAFDLDRQPGVKTASAFQVWGQRDSESKAEAHPMNLGILYMDSEMNRRWVLRYDDPKQIAEIDAVFVTVEPHGGSQKPTGKPFLYALLRKEVNHP